MPPSSRLEALRGNRSGRWSIRIDDQWRVCFRFEDGDAFEVEIVDHHRRNEAMAKKSPVTIHPGEFLKVAGSRIGSRLRAIHPVTHS